MTHSVFLDVSSAIDIQTGAAGDDRQLPPCTILANFTPQFGAIQLGHHSTPLPSNAAKTRSGSG
jgi:hypothetical protein